MLTVLEYFWKIKNILLTTRHTDEKLYIIFTKAAHESASVSSMQFLLDKFLSRSHISKMFNG